MMLPVPGWLEKKGCYRSSFQMALMSALRSFASPTMLKWCPCIFIVAAQCALPSCTCRSHALCAQSNVLFSLDNVDQFRQT